MTLIMMIVIKWDDGDDDDNDGDDYDDKGDDDDDKGGVEASQVGKSEVETFALAVPPDNGHTSCC